MKTINWILFATFSLMAMALVSCNKDITFQEIEQEPAGAISVSVDALMGEYVQGNDTKSGLVSTTRVKWSAEDKVFVYDGASYLGELTVSLKDGKDYYAVLTGESINVPQSGTTKLTLVHSNAFSANPEINEGKVSLDLSSQEGNTTPKDIPFVAFATLDYTSGTPEISGQIADFSLATSLMRLNCSGLEANAAITGAKLTGMSNECVLNITKEGVTIGKGNMGDINISFTGVSASSKGAQTLYAAVAQNESASNQGLTITQTGKSTYSFGSKAREAGKAVNAICQMVKGCIPGMFTVNAEGKMVLFSLGNLWADASDPESLVFNFETHQYDFHNTWNSSHVSHFFWSKSAEEAVKDEYGDEGYSEVDVFFTNNTAETANPYFIVNGEIGKYRTLSVNEWEYLLFSRTVNGGTGKDKAYSLNINYDGAMGTVLYPNNYSGPILVSGTQYTDDTFPIDCVFLPAAGLRLELDIFGYGSTGAYILPSAINETIVRGIVFKENEVLLDEDGYPNFVGTSSRLVADVK